MTALVMSAIGLVAEEYRTVEEFADARRRYNGEWTYPQDPLASNIYSRVKSMYEGHWLSPFDYFLAVRGGGVEMEMETTNFFTFVSFVSNNCSAIAADWPTYETNEMVRFTTLSAPTGCLQAMRRTPTTADGTPFVSSTVHTGRGRPSNI